MDLVVLTDIPFEIDLPSLMDQLRVGASSSLVEALVHLSSEARAVARPKAMYGLAFIDSRGNDHVIIEAIKFSSRVLRINLDPVNRVFPFVVTCGTELAEWASSIDDFLHRYWADRIMQLALTSARQALQDRIQTRFGLGTISSMNPGSLEDWPMQEQRPLFALLGTAEADVGVRLTDSMIMTPLKSVSGLWFATDVDFASCQLCPRGDCPSRRAAYDQMLYEEKYCTAPT